MGITQQQLENVQIDYGIVYINYGETDSRRLGPVRGGGEFNATATIRDIECDESKGKTKGLQAIEDINATLKVVVLDSSMQTLSLAMPYATYDSETGTITCKSSNLGIIPDESYLKNITMFAKTVKGEYRKITLYNAMAENDFTLAAKPKGEGEISLEAAAHWDATDDTKDLFKVETVTTIS